MATLPVSTALTGSAITEAQAKTWFTQLRDFLSGLLGTAGTIQTALAALQVPFAQGLQWVSGAYSVTTADRGKVLGIGAAVKVTLPAAATAGSGFMIAVHSFVDGAVVDGNGAELIDGAALLPLNTGESAILVCSGSEWWTVGQSVNQTVTLAAGSLVYACDLTEQGAAISNNTYPEGLASKTSESAIARWLNSLNNFKAIKMWHSGTVTVSFASRHSTGTTEVRILKNTSAVQTWTNNTSTYATRTANVTVAMGDIIALQAREDAGKSIYVKDFQILVAELP